MMTEILLGVGEWGAWIVFCYYALLGYNRLLLWLWFLTAEMQRKIDERDDMP